MTSDQERIEAIIELWEKDPGKLFDWRSSVLKLACLTLESIIKNPKGQGRAQDLSRIRAISQLQSLTDAMEQYRMDVPVVCPNCDHEFTLK